MVTLGEKLKYFRKRAGLSQMAVETSVDMAAGQLSRIENNEVNPTKETLKKISDILELNLIEELFLDGAYAEPVDLNSPQVRRAVDDVMDILNNPKMFAYVTDERYRIFDASKGFKMVLDLTENDIKKAFGNNLLEFIFDTQNPVYPFLHTGDYEELARFQIARFKKQVSYWPIDEYSLNLIESLKSKNPEFERYWNEPESSTYSDDTRAVTFRINGHDIKMNYSREPLGRNLRLNIVIYRPHNLLLRILNSLR